MAVTHTPIRRALLAAFTVTAFAWCRPAGAWTAPVPDVVLYGPPALDHVMHTIAARYTARSDVNVHVFIAPPDGLIGLLAHRARADLVLADAATMARMAARGLVRPGSVVTLGDDPYVLVAAAAAAPNGASAVQLAAARTTVLPDPTTAASFDGAAVLRTAAPGAMATIGVADTPTVIAQIRGDPRLLGLVLQTEAGASGIKPVATLPAPPVAFSGALVTEGQSGRAAELLAFVASPDGRAMLRDAGMEPTK